MEELKDALKSHTRIHIEEKPYICPVCGNIYTLWVNFMRHIKDTHISNIASATSATRLSLDFVT